MPLSLFVRRLLMLGNLKHLKNSKYTIKRRKLQHPNQQTNVNEVSHKAKISNKTASINVRNHCLYAS